MKIYGHKISWTEQVFNVLIGTSANRIIVFSWRADDTLDNNQFAVNASKCDHTEGFKCFGGLNEPRRRRRSAELDDADWFSYSPAETRSNGQVKSREWNRGSVAFRNMIYAGGQYGNAAMFGIPTGIKTTSNSDEAIVSDSSSNYYWGGDRTDVTHGKSLSRNNGYVYWGIIDASREFWQTDLARVQSNLQASNFTDTHNNTIVYGF